jgi:hypothetical protein
VDKQAASKAIRIVNDVFMKMGAKWFLCFGNVLHLIRDKTVEFDKDIDVGCFYEKCDGEQIKKAFKYWQYELHLEIKNDITKKPLYMSFKNTRNPPLPPVDVFLWYMHDGIRYHTFDTKQERATTPSEYKFLGIEAKYLPDPDIPAKSDKKLVKSYFGKWNEPYFLFEVPIPLYYGSCLDTWYPNWLIPRKMTSMSPFEVRMSSCKKWKNPDYIKQQLAENKVKYMEKREQMRKGK